MPHTEKTWTKFGTELSGMAEGAGGIRFFFGAFANLRKATVSFVMYIRLSVRPSVPRQHGVTRLPMDGIS